MGAWVASLIAQIWMENMVLNVDISSPVGPKSSLDNNLAISYAPTSHWITKRSVFSSQAHATLRISALSASYFRCPQELYPGWHLLSPITRATAR